MSDRKPRTNAGDFLRLTMTGELTAPAAASAYSDVSRRKIMALIRCTHWYARCPLLRGRLQQNWSDMITRIQMIQMTRYHVIKNWFLRFFICTPNVLVFFLYLYIELYTRIERKCICLTVTNRYVLMKLLFIVFTDIYFRDKDRSKTVILFQWFTYL